jgi:hypothetical protein
MILYHIIPNSGNRITFDQYCHKNVKYFLQDLRFPERRSWNFKSSEMLHCVVGSRMFNVSNFGSTFAFRVKLYPENYGTTNIQNVEHS